MTEPTTDTFYDPSPSDDAISYNRGYADGEAKGRHDAEREAAARAAGIDAETLARAMSLIGRRVSGTGFGAYADEVVVEYARLAAEKEVEHE